MTASPSHPSWIDRPAQAVMTERPVIAGFLLERGIELPAGDTRPLRACLMDALPSDPAALDGLVTALVEHVQQVDALLGVAPEVGELTIITGRDKRGKPEGVSQISLRPGDIVALVGPTGSGKSRLLADIEWMAAGDTPTGRWIHIDGKPADTRLRHVPSRKLVAQLSQTMSFVVDLEVGEFLALHAECRGVSDVAERVAQTLDLANQLSGEPFRVESAVSSLSGGQSRALMIADVAVLGRSPVILVDEIENAGIDRRRALDVLVTHEKIVLLATHDPLLALLAPRRVVLANGGIRAMIERDDAELAMLEGLERAEHQLWQVRARLRAGRRATDLPGDGERRES